MHPKPDVLLPLLNVKIESYTLWASEVETLENIDIEKFNYNLTPYFRFLYYVSNLHEAYHLFDLREFKIVCKHLGGYKIDHRMTGKNLVKKRIEKENKGFIYSPILLSVYD